MRDFNLHSGERTPWLRFDDISDFDLARYQFAAEYLADKDYRFGIDAFCGAGYGTLVLAEKLAADIIAIDGSLGAIQEASRRVGHSNIMFTQKFFPFTLPKDWAEFIVSIESIEHVEDGEAFARITTQALKPGGTLIVTAPNDELNPHKIYPYHWHFKHYKPKEIIDMYTGFGLTFKSVYAQDANAFQDRKPIICNFFSPIYTKLRPGSDGDTCLYIFERAKA